MKQLKALIIKDIHTNKKFFFLPMWLMLSLYLLIGVVFTIARAKSGTCINWGGVPSTFLTGSAFADFFSFAIQVGLYFGIVGIIFGIPIMGACTFILNGDVKEKCELFHRSQPVSVWKLTASRYIVIIGGLIVLSLFVGIIQLITSNIMISVYTPMQVNLWMALNGMLISWLHLSISIGVIGSIGFLLSAIFKENAFGKGALVLAVLEIAVFIVNYFLNLGVPSPFAGLVRLMFSSISTFVSEFPNVNYAFNVSTNKFNSLYPNTVPTQAEILSKAWSSLFTWGVALRLAVCGALYTLATCVYHRREVQF